MGFMHPEKVRWEALADRDGYPSTDATTPPQGPDGEAFEVRLAQPLTIYALRMVGHAGGNYAGCAELSACT